MATSTDAQAPAGTPPGGNGEPSGGVPKAAPRRLGIKPGWYRPDQMAVWREVERERARSTVWVQCDHNGPYDILRPLVAGGTRWSSKRGLDLVTLESELTAEPAKRQCWICTPVGDWGDSDRVRGLVQFLQRDGWEIVVIERPSGDGVDIINILYADK